MIGGILVYGFFMGSWCVIGVLWPCVQALEPTRVAQLVDSFRGGDFGVNVLKKPSLLAFDRQMHTFAYILYIPTCIQAYTSISPVLSKSAHPGLNHIHMSLVSKKAVSGNPKISL